MFRVMIIYISIKSALQDGPIINCGAKNMDLMTGIRHHNHFRGTVGYHLRLILPPQWDNTQWILQEIFWGYIHNNGPSCQSKPVG